MSYKVIVCPDEMCHAVSIVSDDDSQTIKCRKCDSQRKAEKYKVSYRTTDRQDAVAARTKLLMKLNDDDMSFDEVKEKGYLQEPEKIFSKKKERDSRSPKLVIRESFEEFEEPTTEQIIEESIKSNKLDREKAQKVIEAMIRDGEILDYGDRLKLL